MERVREKEDSHQPSRGERKEIGGVVEGGDFFNA